MRPIAIDGGEAKEKLCMEIGAEAFVDFTKTKDVAGRIKEIAGGVGAHGVVVTAYQAYKGKSSRSSHVFIQADKLFIRCHQLRW